MLKNILYATVDTLPKTITSKKDVAISADVLGTGLIISGLIKTKK